MPTPLPTASVFAFLKLLLPRWQRRRVNGRSMHPTLPDDSTVLVDTAVSPHTQLQIGDIVLAQHPYQPSNQMIKRITAVTEDGRYFLQGDNSDSLASTDSRSFGPVQTQHILGKVTHRF
ncbi:nickel-type superoxide dismutase maturation protease [Candidatus Leptofilum sp.]|uniref:nickel-type superoxide dismutase maturation protease n=1 Tax=Candidatus Leptofilum sp. TaxID=3241576 RepID=UPI003B5A5451